MQAWFDATQKQLAGLINSPADNNVGHFVKEIFNTQGFAGGGLADTDGLRSESNDLSLTQRILSSVDKGVSGADSAALGKAGDNPLGGGFYNSAPYIASHYTNLGKFFSGAEPGNYYTNKYEQPVKGQAPKSDSPNTFYSQFYEGMRRFSEASEIANAGQTIVRPR